MGNSIQAKKKVQTEENSPVRSSTSSQRVKSKGSWLFGRRDKVKTATGAHKLGELDPCLCSSNKRYGKVPKPENLTSVLGSSLKM
ncbi:hypothetical protein D4764_21G0002730 [Takifugu flavidus]|uniref:Uncharacterized protein n=1 Tax=Takifugu flavidus TaxID=433684 RepID=A0A5C6NDV4_9TELE|nr:hypothetical protein D4764_21G0002730 [Takifugu flavidus]